MDYQLNMKNILSSKRSFHGKKLQYQENVVEQSNFPPSTTTTLSSTYLTADSPWKTVATIVSPKLEDGQKRQVERNQLKLFFFLLFRQSK
jgi:hypothetical protein